MNMNDSTRIKTGATESDVEILGTVLEDQYSAFNRRDFIHPDPLEVVYNYESGGAREVAGLIAACLAYGRVAQILKNVDTVLDVLGDSPHEYLMRVKRAELEKRLSGFKHRWTTPEELVDFLLGMGAVLRRHGSLEACFLSHHPVNCVSTVPGLVGFTRELRDSETPTSLLSAPEKGSACKRLHLYLRWMARSDDVDPGCWRDVSPAQLVVPLDTHMHRIARSLGLTQRKQANLVTALEVTEAFRVYCAHDPVRFDFCLTRLGIRQEMDLEGFLSECHRHRATTRSEHDSPVRIAGRLSRRST